MDETAPTVAEVLGRTARELRGDRKIELVSRAAQSAGLKWGTGRVADLEAGRVSPTLPTVLMLCVAFSDLLERPMRLADLFAGDGPVALSPSVTVNLDDFRAALLGLPVPGPELEVGDTETATELRASGKRSTRISEKMRQWDRVNASFLEADIRLARSLGLTRQQAVIVMDKLWGRSFSDERDRRGGPGANPQKRGRISRELKRELQEEVSRGDD